MLYTTVLQREIVRKLIHLSSLWIPLLYYLSDYLVMSGILLIITPIVTACDILRNQESVLGNKVRYIYNTLHLNNILRPHERKGALSGAAYMLISALICLFLFPKPVFIVAFTVLMLADTLAALLGSSFGARKLIGNKTLLGTIAFLTTSIIVSIKLAILLDLQLRYALFAAVAATIAETLSEKLKIDDNLLIPLAYGSVYIGLYIFG